MAKRSDCCCIPIADGYYWATHRKYGWRAIVMLRPNGQSHRRAFAAGRAHSTFDVCEFHQWSRQLRDPLKRK